MRRIALEELQPGMLLSKPLLSPDGKVLLHEGLAMKERYIAYLRHQGISYVYIDDPQTQDIVVEDVITPKLRLEAMKRAQQAVTDFRVGKGVTLDGVKSTISTMIQQLSSKPENMLHFMDIRRKEDYLFAHAVNVCILSVMTGISLGYTKEQLEELGLAAMVHDVGKIRFPKKLSMKNPGKLSEEEKEEYRQHPFYSMEILKESGLPVNVVRAAFEHHERWNGSGYPMGLEGDTISEYAQILSLADVYDRLTMGTPHRRPTPPYYAAAIINKASGEYFNPDIVEKFNENIAVYPIGTMVQLNNYQTGVIVEVSKENKNIPIVRIMSGQDNSKLNQLLELDLHKNPELFIVDFEEL